MLVAIIGAGPAGCALACLLAARGVECIVFDDERRPGLLVGESLVPAVVPYLRRLGIENEVARIAARKKGAALRHPDGQRVNFIFRRLGRGVPDYSYNIPRPAFDDVLKRRAEQLGVRFVLQRATLEKSDSGERDIQLSCASLKLAALHEHPELLVDATGRSRLLSRALSLPALRGERDSVSYFAHYEKFGADNVVEGQVVLSVIDSGWSWQIPLNNCVSVGVVLDKRLISHYGGTPEQRLENIINLNPVLSQSGLHRKRISRVMAYSNYQLMTQKGYGNGWVLLGDAYGFVDPMLSPGVFMALESAVLLDQLVFKQTSDDARSHGLAKYTQQMDSWHQSWAGIIDYFYDGRLLALFEAGQEVLKHSARWSFARV